MIREFDKNRHEPKNIAGYKRMTTILIPDQHVVVRICVFFFNYGREGTYDFAEPHEQGSSRCIRFCTAGVLRRCLYAATWRSVSGQKTT